MLHELISILDDHLESMDYWYDVGCEDAREFLYAHRNLLDELKMAVAEWPDTRLEKLAYILGESTDIREREILEWLAEHGDDEVAYTARESLRDMATRGT